MSVLIRGMKMPTTPEKCTFYENVPFRPYPHCKAYFGGNCFFPDDCPLIEIPPHGRLIDADALLDRFERESKSANEHGRDFSFCFMSNNEPCAEWWAVEQIVEDFITTNTVIEAEEAKG